MVWSAFLMRGDIRRSQKSSSICQICWPAFCFRDNVGRSLCLFHESCDLCSLTRDHTGHHQTRPIRQYFWLAAEYNASLIVSGDRHLLDFESH